MAISTDIVATYRGPRRAFAMILGRGVAEPRALAFLMAGCVLAFISQWPKLSRDAHINGTDLNADMGGALLAWVFIAPLLLYFIAFLIDLAARALRFAGNPFGARIALFWSLLAATPLMLLNGLVAGFIGNGPALQIVGFAWFAVFMWFWISGLRAAYAEPAEQ